VRLGYKNVYRMPTGYFGWKKDVLKHDAPVKNDQFLGSYFPECQFVSINRGLDQNYLGIKESIKKIRLTEINSQFIYVALFNEMCLQCVEEMKQFGQLFERFQKGEKFKNSVKIIGIGAGSTHRSARKFVNLHNISFPIFADKNWTVFQCLGEPPLPVSYLLKKEPGNRLKIELIQKSHIQNVSDMLTEISSFIDKK
jgi:hypothetical protein